MSSSQGKGQDLGKKSPEHISQSPITDDQAKKLYEHDRDRSSTLNSYPWVIVVTLFSMQ